MESQSVFEVAEVFVTKRILKSLKSSSDEVLESQSVFGLKRLTLPKWMFRFPRDYAFRSNKVRHINCTKLLSVNSLIVCHSDIN